MDRKEMIALWARGIPPIDITIQKWNEILSFLKDLDVFDEKADSELDDYYQSGSANCALCEVYSVSSLMGGVCQACPICMIKGAHHTHCEDTPYDLFIDAQNDRDLDMLIKATEQEILLLEEIKAEMLKKPGEWKV